MCYVVDSAVVSKNQGDVMSALKALAGSSASYAALPSKVISSSTPVGTVRLLARVGGIFPLLLWWAFSVSRGVLPAVMAWLVSE